MIIPNNPLIIAVDFDGTIVDDAYTKIGKEIIFAIYTLKKLQSEGHRLILWTYRHGKRLDEAVAFCKENNLEFYAINKNFPEEEYDQKYSRKINADLFIDDRNVGGFLGWTEIHKAIFNYETPKKNKKGFFSFFK